MKCSCGNICAHGKRRHASTVNFNQTTHSHRSQAIRWGEASVEIRDMATATARQRGLNSYDVTCTVCNETFLCNAKGAHLYVSIDEGDPQRGGRRFTMDEAIPSRSLLYNFPLCLRKFIVPAKVELQEAAPPEHVSDDMIDIDLDSREWFGHSFTPHILLSEFAQV